MAVFPGQSRPIGILYWRYFFTPPKGWGEARGLYLATSWYRQGYQVWVLTGGSYFPADLRKRLKKRRVFRTADGLPIIWFPTPYHQKQPLWQRLWSFVRFTIFSFYIFHRLRRENLYILAVVPPPTTLWGAALWRKLTRQPFALEVTDVWPQVLEDLGFVKTFFRRLLRKAFAWGYQKADFIAAYSPGILESLHLLAGKTPLFVSHNGAHPVAFRRAGPPPYLPFRLVYAGTFGRINNLDFLLEVARHLVPWRGIQIWLLGDGSELERIKKQAQTLPNIQLFPPVPAERLPYWLNQCHIGVSTILPVESLSRNAASKFYIYLASGLVVGINHAGWQAQILEEYQCGFSATDPYTFAQKALEYYRERHLWWDSQARGRLIAERFFDIRTIGVELLEKVCTFALNVRSGLAQAEASALRV